MVSLSMYRGNMHRVPDAPRRWLMPDQNIPFKRFKALHNRRLKALKRVELETTPFVAITNPNPSLSQIGGTEAEKEELKDLSGVAEKEEGEGEVEEGCEVVEGEDFEKTEKVPELSDTEKRKKEAEEKLQALNTKKHGLVQLLKQILNAEEEMKRRSLMQGSANCPLPSLHVDVQNESDPMSRHATPRTGSETNHGTDMDGVEAYDNSNHMSHPRSLYRVSSVSPSSDSPSRRYGYFQHNTVPQPWRAAFGAASPSPSRFAPTPPQVHSTSFTPISVCTTNYVGTLPSPAASGGTPVFRDTRHPSPWS